MRSSHTYVKTWRRLSVWTAIFVWLEFMFGVTCGIFGPANRGRSRSARQLGIAALRFWYAFPKIAWLNRKHISMKSWRSQQRNTVSVRLIDHGSSQYVFMR